MAIERIERVHQHAAQGNTLTVSKARQGYPTNDMSAVVVTERRVLIKIRRDDNPFPGIVMEALTAVIDLEDARDLGQAILLAADELLAEQAKDDQP